MAKMKYELDSARRMVEKTGGSLSISNKHVTHPRPGIKILGAIDYLVKVHGYVRVREI